MSHLKPMIIVGMSEVIEEESDRVHPRMACMRTSTADYLHLFPQKVQVMHSSCKKFIAISTHSKLSFSNRLTLCIIAFMSSLQILNLPLSMSPIVKLTILQPFHVTRVTGHFQTWNLPEKQRHGVAYVLYSLCFKTCRNLAHFM